MIWLGLAVYQTDINCRAYKNCRQSQIFFKKNVAKLLTTKVVNFFIKKCLHFLCRYGKVKNCDVISYPCSPVGGGPETRRR